MASATTLEYIETGMPSVEIVRLELTDGETYTSRKFKTVTGAIAMLNVDSDNHVQATFSGAVVTVAAAGQTDQPVTLLVTGKH